MAEATDAARQEVVRARRAAESELDTLGSSARAAFDIPAKVRAHPVETVGVAGGAAFLLLGGPKRMAKAVERRFFPEREKRPPTLLPKDVDATVNRLPADDREQVRAHLERDFARYIQRQHAKDPPTARASVWKTYDMFLGIVGAAAARELVKKLFQVPAEARVEQAQEDSKAAAEIQQSGAGVPPSR
jgi:hypothetical protein